MKRQANPVVYGVLALVAFLVGSTGTYWQFVQRSGEVKEIGQLRKNLKDEQKMRTELAATTAKLRESSDKLKHLEQGVPELAYIPTMLTELEVLGKQCGLRVTGVKPKDEKEKKKDAGDETKKEASKKAYQELTLEVKALGSYSSARKFVAELEAFPKIVGIHSLGLVPKKDQNSPTNQLPLEMTVEIRAYVFPLPEAAQATTTASASEVRGRGNEIG